MKKFFAIFLIGQMILLSFIFNQSVYDIYTLNNMGDTSLNCYQLQPATGNTLEHFYTYYQKHYIDTKKEKLQIIKTPVSKDNTLVYEIYHSNVDKVIKQYPISNKKAFNYYSLKKEDFLDSTGVFYTSLSKNEIQNVSNTLNIKITPYPKSRIQYYQIIKDNLLNMLLLLILTQLILFIYTFMRIKINAAKKIMGFSAFRMILDSLKEFLFIEIIALIFVLSAHLIYYTMLNRMVAMYFIGMVFFLLCSILANIILLLITQSSIRFIDIGSMLKNKTFSDKLIYILRGVKVILMIAITLSISLFIGNHTKYTASMKNVEQYRQLNRFYTSNGFNSDEYDKISHSPGLIKEAGDKVKEIYNHYNKSGQALLIDANDLGYLSDTYLEMRNKTKEEILNSYTDNYIVLNQSYISRFMNLKDTNNNEIKEIKINSPCILVPEKYKSKEKEVKECYIQRYESLLNYYNKLNPSEKEKRINDLAIIYLKDNQSYELLGSQYKGYDVKLKDSIILIDTGDFRSSYYYYLLGSRQISFEFSDREFYSSLLKEYGLDKLYNASTLLTPFTEKIRFYEFVMNQSLVFSVLFFSTLLFILYITNYMDIMVNRKKYGIQYMMGFTMKKALQKNLLISCALTLLVIPMYLLKVHIGIYIVILAVDLIFLICFYQQIIKNDVEEIVKGG